MVAMLPNLLSNRTLFSTLVSFGCILTLFPIFRSLISRKVPAFKEAAPAVAMAAALILSLFANNVEEWRKGIFALFLFAAAAAASPSAAFFACQGTPFLIKTGSSITFNHEPCAKLILLRSLPLLGRPASEWASSTSLHPYN